MEVKPENRPEEITDGSSGTGIFTDDIRFNAGLLHTFLNHRLKDGYPAGYAAGYAVIKITRKAEEGY